MLLPAKLGMSVQVAPEVDQLGRQLGGDGVDLDAWVQSWHEP